MRVVRVQQSGSLEFNMTPMIDVTFLLIIFFLVSSHLAHQEVQQELNLPSAESGHAPREDEPERRRVTINVLGDGQVLLGGQEVEPSELRRRIHYEAQQPAQPGQELEVRIRCDRQVAYRHVQPILLACAEGGVWKVTFAVVRKEGGTP